MSFRHIEFDSATDFLAAMRPSNAALWGQDAENRWLYRGHGNADWPLIPSIFRSSVAQENKRLLESAKSRLLSDVHLMQYFRNVAAQLKRNASYFDISGAGTNDECLAHLGSLTYLENRLTQKFAEIGARVGLLARDAEGELRRFDQLVSATFSNGNSIGMIARHHGVPTSALDWTSSATKACFFACADPQRAPLAVWAIDSAAIRAEASRYLILSGDRSTSPFVRAQEAFFTVNMDAHVELMFLGAALDHATHCAKRFGSRAREMLVKVTLTEDQRSPLAKLLWREGVFRAELMPTLDNCWQSTRHFLDNVQTELS